MIRTDVVKLAFIGDGMTKSFDVLIEGIPIAPEGSDNFAVSLVVDDEVQRILEYGVDFQYIANFNARGFSESITLTLTDPLPTGNQIVVVRTTPIIGVSQYPDSGIPPKKVERDFDHVIMILQELGYRIEKLEIDLAKEIEERIEADEEIQEQLDNKINRDEPLPAHAEQHREGGFDQLTPEMIGALRKAPNTGRIYGATTTDGTPGWVELLFPGGALSATTIVQTSAFVADGQSTEFGVSVTHVLNTNHVNAIVYDDETDRRVHFAVEVPSVNAVILKSKVIQPAGRRFRVLLYAPGRIDPGWFRDRFDFVQSAPSTEWIINHDMHNSRPMVLVLDDQMNVQVPAIDYQNATEDSIALRFFSPVAGTAHLYGWMGGDIQLRNKPYYHSQFDASAEWAIPHNLGDYRPTVLVLDPNGAVITPDIDYAEATVNEIVLRFAKPRTGTAIIGVR